MCSQTNQEYNAKLTSELKNAKSKLRDLVLDEYVEKLFKSEEAFNCLFQKVFSQDYYLLTVRRHLETYKEILLL